MGYGRTGLSILGVVAFASAAVAEPAVPAETQKATAENATKVAALPTETAPSTAKIEEAQDSPETASPTTTSRDDAAKAAREPVKTAAIPPVSAKPRPVSPTVYANIDLTRQRMTVKVNGRVRHTWKISSGRAGYHTPRGTFRPNWISRMHYSRQYDGAPMPYSVFFNRGIATHGTNAVSRLGRPASHGCIRLRTSNARTFYNLVRKHGKSRVRISVRGTTPRTSTPVARRNRDRSATRRIARRQVAPVRTTRRQRRSVDEPWWQAATRSQRRATRRSFDRRVRTARRAERRRVSRQLRYVRRPRATRRGTFYRPRARLVFPGDR